MDNTLRVYPRSRWFVLATIFIGYMALGMAIVAYSPIVGVIAGEFNITPGEVSLLAIGSFSIASAIASAVAGILFDKIGWVIPFAVATVIMALGIFLTPYVTSTLTGILVTRILIGIASGPVTSCIANIAAEWFPAKERGTFNGVVSMGITLGMMLTFQIVGGGMAMYNGDWRMAESGLFFGPIAAIVIMIIMLFVVKKTKSALPPMDSYNSDEAEGAKHDYAYVLKQPVYYLILIGMVCYGWVMNSWNDLIPGYLSIPAPVGIGFDQQTVGALMTYTQVGSLLGGFCAGFFIDRVLKGRVRPVLIFAYIVMGISVLAVKFPAVYNDNATLFHVCLFLVGFCMMTIIPSLSNFVARTFPGAIVGKVFATTFGVALLIAAIGVNFGSTMLYITGTYQLPILIIGIVALIGVVPALTLYRPKRFLPEGATNKDMRRM